MNILKLLSRTKQERLLWEGDNCGVTVQVWEKNDRRELRFGNHIMQSVISKIRPNQLVLPYSRFMMLGLLFCTEPQTVLHIGLGGGSIVRWMHREFPETKHTVIEKNSAVIEAARRFFELPQDNRLRLLKADVTEIIPTLTEKFDIILLDAYTDYGAPEEVKCVEFLRNLRGCLNSTGWLAGNTWTMTGDFLEQCEIWKSTFTQVLQARANLKGNVILLGSQISQLPDKKNFQETAKILNKRHRLDFQKMLRELQAVV